MGHGGTTTCYMSGVRIRTARGEVPVETIGVGDDVVVVRDSGESLEPVRWVGSLDVNLSSHPHVELVAPIRIRASALADGQPSRDLLVSPEHCLIIDGLCIPAKLLVNGGSIVSERSHSPFTYYHIELDRHGALVAENALAESYLDTGNRYYFDDQGPVQALFPGMTVDAGAERWNTEACAPLARVPDEVEPIWRRLAERSEVIGYPMPAIQVLEGSALHLVADGHAIQPIDDNNARFVFTVPGGVTSVSLVSRFCIPADRNIPEIRDTRRLGVRVSSIVVKSGETEIVYPADHPDLIEGWNDAERDAAAIWRWTDGNAQIPWTGINGPAVMTVHCVPVDAYPVYDENVLLVA